MVSQKEFDASAEKLAELEKVKADLLDEINKLKAQGFQPITDEQAADQVAQSEEEIIRDSVLFTILRNADREVSTTEVACRIALDMVAFLLGRSDHDDFESIRESTERFQAWMAKDYLKKFTPHKSFKRVTERMKDMERAYQEQIKDDPCSRLLDMIKTQDDFKKYKRLSRKILHGVGSKGGDSDGEDSKEDEMDDARPQAISHGADNAEDLDLLESVQPLP